MSIIDALDLTKRVREDLQRQQQLSESMARVSAQFGLTEDELYEALFNAVAQKRLRSVKEEVRQMRINKVVSL